MSEQRSVRLDLSEALQFTEEDIAANREGRLSPAQQARLRRGFRRTLIAGIIGIIVIGLGATTLIFLGQQNNSMVLVVLGIALTVLNAFIVGMPVKVLVSLIVVSLVILAFPSLMNGVISETWGVLSRTLTGLTSG